METYGFCRVGAAIPHVSVADCQSNSQEMKELILHAAKKNVKILTFPELSITGYTCNDLFLQDLLLEEVESAVEKLLEETESLPVCFIIGAPICLNSKIYNCALVCFQGEILGIVPKTYLPNYSEFYEKRWFESYDSSEIMTLVYAGQLVPFGTNLLFGPEELIFAVEICEDLWSVIPPGSYHAMAGARMLFNLSASDELAGKRQYLQSLISQQSARCQAAYIYSSAGSGESSTDLVYAGNAFIYENGKLLAESERFQLEPQLIISEIDLELLNSERRKNTTFAAYPVLDDYQRIIFDWDKKENKDFSLSRKINPHPFIPSPSCYNESCDEIFNIQAAGLIQRMMHIKTQSLVLGVSGGLDSTLALLVCVKAVDKLKLPRKMICGVTMPGFGTTGRTYQNADKLMKALGITMKEISIVQACEQHFTDINHDPKNHDVTFENAQARERTQILMNLANQLNGIVIGTGDMSELALGWATYNGDHMSMYGVNSGVPKTLVRYLVKWAAETQVDKESAKILLDIADTPVSPELLPLDEKGGMTQFTEDTVGPYELHDFFLFYTLRYGFSPSKIYFLTKQAFKDLYGNETILKWMKVFYKRFFSQQFKRNCMPDGPKIGSVNLSPRGDWRMPSDASANLWLREIDSIKD
ncbi:NAD(+) synthase [Bacteroidales bacterium OttesenSCG-928-A17]|nr:NAD(+) synthase [Bacteroidales bacterium OttesenSCG-928-A17]